MNEMEPKGDDWPVAEEKLCYAKHWKHSASNMQRQGCYDWMCAQLGGHTTRKVLEIGCGSGEGTEALNRTFGCRIISIEKNPVCMQKAGELLTESGFVSDRVYRLEYEQLSDGRHRIVPDQTPIQCTSQVTFVQGDILLNDEALVTFMREEAPFDLITVWLMGSFLMRWSCVNLDNMPRESPREYVTWVQRQVYQMANEFLSPGGKLQIVDRGPKHSGAPAVVCE